MVRLDPNIGALLALPESYNKETLPKRVLKSDIYKKNEVYNKAAHVQAVYVHISKALDERDASKFGKDFAPSTTHSVRLLSCGNWMDGVATGGCAPSILEAHVLTHANLKAGQVYKQVPGGGGVVLHANKKKNATSKEQLSIEAFGFSKLAKGTTILGVVKEVQDDYAVVSLPNMLSGYVLPNNKENSGLEL
jgi:hypothetical protein